MISLGSMIEKIVHYYCTLLSRLSVKSIPRSLDIFSASIPTNSTLALKLASSKSSINENAAHNKQKSGVGQSPTTKLLQVHFAHCNRIVVKMKKEIKLKIFFSSHDMFQRVIKQTYDLKRQRVPYQSTCWSLTAICHALTNLNRILKVCTATRFYWTLQFRKIWRGVRILRRWHIFCFCNSIGSWSLFCQSFHQRSTHRMCLALSIWWTDVRNGWMTCYFTNLSSLHSFELIFQSIKIGK